MPAVDPVAFNANTRVSWSQITNKPDWTGNISGGGYNPLVIDLMNGRVANSGPVREFDSTSVQNQQVITKAYVDSKTSDIDRNVNWNDVQDKPQWTDGRFTISPNDNLALRGNLDMDRSVIMNVSDPLNPGDAVNKNYLTSELGKRDVEIARLEDKLTEDVGDASGAVLRDAKAYTDQVFADIEDPQWSDIQNKPEYLERNVFEYASTSDRNKVNVYTDLDMSTMQIKNVGDPSIATDVANKRFVEQKVAGMATVSDVDTKIAAAVVDIENPDWADVENKPLWTQHIESRRTVLNGSETTALNFKVNVDMNNQIIANVSAPIAAKDAANKEWVERTVNSKVGDIQFDVPIADVLTLDNDTDPTEITTSVPLNVNGKRLRGLTTPTASDHAATKSYVDDKTWNYETKITNKPTIPSKLSDLTNDIVIDDVPLADQLRLDNDAAPTEMVAQIDVNVNNKRLKGVATPTLNDHAANKSYVDGKTWSYTTQITNKPTIPSKLSELQNDLNLEDVPLASHLTLDNETTPTKITTALNIDMNNKQLNNLPTPTLNGQAANKQYVDNKTWSYTSSSITNKPTKLSEFENDLVAADVPLADEITLNTVGGVDELTAQRLLNMNSKSIKGLPAPTANDHAATKLYVDGKTWDWTGSSITNKPTIPTQTSQLTNNSSFITSTQSTTAIDNKFANVVDSAKRLIIKNHFDSTKDAYNITQKQTGAQSLPVRDENYDVSINNSFVPETHQQFSLGAHLLRWNYLYSRTADAENIGRPAGSNLNISTLNYTTDGVFDPVASWKFQPNASNNKILDLAVVANPISGSTATPVLKASVVEAANLTLSNTPTAATLNRATNVGFVLNYVAAVNAMERYLQSTTTFQVFQSAVDATQFRTFVRARTDSGMSGTNPFAHIFVRQIKFKLVITEYDSTSNVMNEHYNQELTMTEDATAGRFTRDATITLPTATPAILTRSNVQITYSPIIYYNANDEGTAHVITPDRDTYRDNPTGRALEAACTQIRVSPPS